MTEDIMVGEFRRLVGPQTAPIRLSDLSPELQALAKAAIQFDARRDPAMRNLTSLMENARLFAASVKEAKTP